MKRNSKSKNKSVLGDIPIKKIKARSGWQVIDFKELKEYRDLFYFMVWREIKVLYAQTILGFSWAILNPLVQIVIFTVIFGKDCQAIYRGYSVFSFFKCGYYTLDLYVTVNDAIQSKSCHGAGNAGKNIFSQADFSDDACFSESG